VQKPHPPIMIGASSTWAVERVVDYADGWMPITGACDLEERLALLARLCEQKGRDRKEINVTLFGSPAGQAEIDQLAKLGVDRVLLPLPTEDEGRILERLDRYQSLIAA